MKSQRLRPIAWRGAAVLLASLTVDGCAVPATEVKIATMPMRDAYELNRQLPVAAPGRPEAMPRLVAPALPEGAPRPLISTPDVRLAYLYEWVDPEGNRHFGEWVAIAVSGFDWIMSDGAHESMSDRAALPADAKEQP